MKMKEVKLLKSLIGIKSISGEENEITDFLFNYINEMGFSPNRVGNNVYFVVGDGKKTLLLNSHLDTVPAGDGWETEPFMAVEKDGKIYGRGTSDAKGCVAAMLYAVKELDFNNVNGRVVYAATCEEEIGGEGLERLLNTPDFPEINSAVIGEPTDFRIGIAIKGLLYITLKVYGKAAHAARPEEGENAIHKAAELIKNIDSLIFQSHPLLGVPTIQTTYISGAGKSKNTLPEYCEFSLDIRTTPYYDNNKILEILKGIVGDKARIIPSGKRNDGIFPKETDANSEIVQATSGVGNGIYGFPAMCDFAFLKCPGIIFGPGKSEHSHAPNENIAIDSFYKAKESYKKVIINYFKS